MNRKRKALKDNSPLGQMRSLVEELTRSGQKELNGKLMSSLRSICKQSDEFVRRSYQMIMHQLQKDHAEVRYSASQIIDDFFRRAHTFRELLLDDMQQYMELTIGINEENPLPLPSVTAKAMRKRSLHCIHEWNQKYGNAYKKLSLAYKFLKNCHKVDFGELAMQNSIEHQRQLELERKKQEFIEAKSKKILREIEENEAEIQQTITSMENCLSLLLPHPKDFFLNDEDGKPTLSVDEKDNRSMQETKKRNPEGIKGVSSESVAVSRVEPRKSENHDIEMSASDPQCDEDSNESELSDDQVSSSSDSEEEPEEDINLREYGVLNPLTSITIDLKPKPVNFEVTEENSAVAENARDLFVILSNRHLNDIKKWIQILSKSSHSEKLKSLINLKNSVEILINKYNELNLTTKKLVCGDSDDSDTSDFEEVKPKDDFEEKAIEPLPSTSRESGNDFVKSNKADLKPDWHIISSENNEEDPTSAFSTVSKIVKDKMVKEKKSGVGDSNISSNKGSNPVCNRRPVASTSGSSKDSRKSKLLAVAPKVPFDLDLYHWENEQVPSSVMRTSHPDAHNIWSTAALDGDDPEIPVELSGTTRVIEFSGKFTPVKWSCRAPLSSGKLCPRKDREKCPFHGPIVPRDEQGNVCEVDGKLPELPPEKPKVPDWQDPEFLRDIQSQTGIDLTIPEKGKRKKKQPKYPDLADIKAAQNTAYNRLAKKIFKKSTMKRVASTLDAIDHKKFRDKFGDQFNYS
ncbi:UV-stimulated scaffold protein A-like [Hetaerina americana]|uniref:UV-stimulated scaffold protein A-like n=1 Tax=Hetaerina americana TaxID=62018 RepID=UPI003A7F391B